MANQVMMQHLYWRKLTLNPAVLFRWNPLNTCPKDLLGLPPRAGGGGGDVKFKAKGQTVELQSQDVIWRYGMVILKAISI